MKFVIQMKITDRNFERFEFKILSRVILYLEKSTNQRCAMFPTSVQPRSITLRRKDPRLAAKWQLTNSVYLSLVIKIDCYYIHKR